MSGSRSRGENDEAWGSPHDASEHAFRDIFERALPGIFQTTPGGNYIKANPALARIYGYASPTQLLETMTDIGRQLYVDPNRRSEFVQLMQANGSLSGFESAIRRRDGTEIWISENCWEVRSTHGELVYYEGTVENITERKHAEVALLAAQQRAEQSSKAKSTFLANMSHELRTPLNAIMGFSELIAAETLGPLGDPRYREYVDDIYRSGKHLLALISDVLDLAKVEAEQMKLDLQAVELTELVENAARLLSENAHRRNIVLTVEPPSGNIVAMVDRTRLKQILFNLLSNAVKFTPEGKTVTVGHGRDGDGLYLRVADTGIGMSPDEIVMAMQPFQQVDNSFSRSHDGTGLGLPITQSLVELHGGKMTIDSVIGAGTVVTVRLPDEAVVDWGVPAGD